MLGRPTRCLGALLARTLTTILAFEAGLQDVFPWPDHGVQRKRNCELWAWADRRARGRERRRGRSRQGYSGIDSAIQYPYHALVTRRWG
jgi:hypothetical protein